MRQKEWSSTITDTDDKHRPDETVLSTLLRWHGPPKNSFKAPQKGTELDSLSSTGYEMLAYPTGTPHLHTPTLKSNSSTLSTQPSLQCNYAITQPDSLGIVGAHQVWVQLRVKSRGQGQGQKVKLKSFCVGGVHYCEQLGANVSTQALLLAPSTASLTKSPSFLSRMFVWVRKLTQDGNKDTGGTKVVPLSGLTRTTLTGKELTNARRCALDRCEQFWACCTTERVAKNKVATSRFLHTPRNREVSESEPDTNADTDTNKRHRVGAPPWIVEKTKRLQRKRLSPNEALQLEREQKFPAVELRKLSKVTNTRTNPVPTAKAKPVPTTKSTVAANTKASLAKMAMAVTRTVANRKAVPKKVAATRKAAAGKVAAGGKPRSKLVHNVRLVVRGATKTAAAKATTATKAAAARTTAATKAAATKAAVAKKRAAAAKAANFTARATAARRASMRGSSQCTGSTQLAPSNPQMLAQLADLAEKQQNTQAMLQSSFKELRDTMIQFSSSDDQAKAAATNMLAAQLAAVQQPRRSPRRSPIQPAGRPNSWANTEALYLSQDRNAQGERQLQLERDRISLERDRITAKREREDQARASAPASAPASNSASALLPSASRLYAACACTLPVDAGRNVKTRTRSGAGAGGPEDARADTTGGAHSLFKVLQPRQTNLFRWAQR